MERTFAVIKPDAVRRNITGKILDRIEAAGFSIVGMKRILLTKEQAMGFYYVHRERPFYDELCSYMASGPIVVLALEKEDAIAGWRSLMGATNPADAAEGTIRREFGLSLGENSVHGSDSPESAAFEIPYFFNCLELV
jgi:nucleoside-diphosphate kinase